MTPRKQNKEIRTKQDITLDRGAKARTIIQIGALNIDVSKRLLIGIWIGLLLQSGITIGFLRLNSQQNNTSGGEMTGGFNVAVSPFGQLDENGRVVASAKGTRMAQEAYRVVVDNFEKSGLDYDKRPPGNANILTDQSISIDDFEEKIEELAGKFKADLLIYGYLENDNKKLALKVYLNAYRMPNARDLTDDYPIEDPSTTESVETNQAAYREMLKDIKKLSVALAKFGLGVGYFSMDQIGESQGFFKDLAEAEGTAPEFRKVIYLFQSKINLIQRDYDGAQRYLELAFEPDETYLRALLGLGQLDYLRASYVCSDTSPDLITGGSIPEDRTLEFQAFEDAIQRFEEAQRLDSERPKPEAHIRIKADYYIGRVYHCMSTAELEDHWIDAQCKYWSVIYASGAEEDWLADCADKPADLDTNSSVTRDLAANAYADLAVLNWQRGWSIELQGDPAEAEKYYSNTETYLLKAIEHSDHFDERALSQALLADFYQKQDRCEEAQEHLQIASDQYFNAYHKLNPYLPNEEFEKMVAEVQSGFNCICLKKCESFQLERTGRLR